jgi:hypothetical protein
VGAYYYFIAQLPVLSYGEVAPFSSQHFKTVCVEFLASKDYSLLEYCALSPEVKGSLGIGFQEAMQPTGSPLIDGWRQWERALRLQLVYLRAQQLQRDIVREIPQLPEVPFEPREVATIAKNAITCESPLEAELYLDRSRWSTIELLKGFDYFGRDTVFGYYLQLLLLERKAQFSEEVGYREYKNLYTSIMETTHANIPVGELK